jgi:hypothetical protein
MSFFFNPPDFILSHWDLNCLLKSLLRCKFVGFVNEDEFHLTFIKHTLLCLVCWNMFLADICHIPVGTVRCAVCTLYCNIQSKAFKWCCLPFLYISVCIMTRKPQRVMQSQVTNYMLVKNKVHPASCYSQHEIHVNVTPFFLNRHSHSLVTQSYVLIRS